MSEFPTDPLHDEGAALDALDVVREVMAWYGERIGVELRAEQPDQARLREWTAGRQAAAADQARLRTADVKTAAAIGERYAALLKELRGR